MGILAINQEDDQKADGDAQENADEDGTDEKGDDDEGNPNETPCNFFYF